MVTTRIGLTVLVALLLVAGSPVVAEQGDMRVQFGLLYNMSTDQLDGMGVSTEADDALGVQVSFEYMITDLIGIEPAFGFATQDIEIETGAGEFDGGDLDYRVLSANLNFHLVRNSSVDFFVGGTVGYTFWGDFNGAFIAGTFPVEDDFVYGVNVGVDVPFGQSAWSFTGSVRYLAIDIELEGAMTDIPFDPLQVKAGVSYRF